MTYKETNDQLEEALFSKGFVPNKEKGKKAIKDLFKAFSFHPKKIKFMYAESLKELVSMNRILIQRNPYHILKGDPHALEGTLLQERVNKSVEKWVENCLSEGATPTPVSKHVKERILHQLGIKNVSEVKNVINPVEVFLGNAAINSLNIRSKKYEDYEDFLSNIDKVTSSETDWRTTTIQPTGHNIINKILKLREVAETNTTQWPSRGWSHSAILSTRKCTLLLNDALETLRNRKELEPHLQAILDLFLAGYLGVHGDAKFMILLQRPEEVVFDEDTGRVHNTESYALVWTKNDRTYRLQDVRLKPMVFKKYKDANVKDILADIHNIEERRALLAHRGPDAFFEDLKPKLIHKNDETGNELYETTITFMTGQEGSWSTGWKPAPEETLVRILRYKCPSTERVYSKFVSPTDEDNKPVDNADVAQAQSHHMSLKRYMSIDQQS